MGMNQLNDTQLSINGGKSAFDKRSQSRFRNQQCFSTLSRKFDFKNPRFSEWNSCPRIPLSVNRSKLAIPYKSELCQLFQRGKCYYGKNCHYAHHMSEISNQTVAMKEHLSSKGRNDMWRMKVCHFFSSGIACPYGDKCHFPHKCVESVRRDVGLHREGCAINAVNRRSDRSGSDQIECRSLNTGECYDKSVFYKTKLCQNWERFGSCPYGVKCSYAHGRADLQELGSFAMGSGHASRFILDSQPNNAALCEVGIKTAKELQMKGERCFMNWDVEKISQIYADWVDDRHNFHVSLSKVSS